MLILYVFSFKETRPQGILPEEFPGKFGLKGAVDIHNISDPHTAFIHGPANRIPTHPFPLWPTFRRTPEKRTKKSVDLPKYLLGHW
jgi:hypothetical protein